MPVSVFDVAKYILRKNGPMTAMKLQKLVYYSQAWSLVWDDKPLFSENIEAWANGPVVRELFSEHKGQYEISTIAKGDISTLSKDQIETINVVLGAYGQKTSQELSDLTHAEEPWRKTREKAGLGDRERGNEVIDHVALAEFYGDLARVWERSE